MNGGYAGLADRTRRAASDTLGLFVVPALLALLPWALTFRLLRLLAARTHSFRNEADAAWNIARDFVEHPDERAFKTTYKLTRWIERVDSYLTLLRSTRWWLARTDIRGEWPDAGMPCLFLTYHWGAGHWVWKCLDANGFRAYFLARRPQVADMGVSRIALWYGRFRSWGFSRIGSLGPLFTGGSMERMRGAFAQGEHVVGMLDLPPDGSASARPVTLLGRPAVLPGRLVESWKGTDIGFALIRCSFDLATGRRQLAIEALARTMSADEVFAIYVKRLDDCLQQAPALWMMWHEAPAMFVGTARNTSRDTPAR